LFLICYSREIGTIIQNLKRFGDASGIGGVVADHRREGIDVCLHGHRGEVLQVGELRGRGDEDRGND